MTGLTVMSFSDTVTGNVEAFLEMEAQVVGLRPTLSADVMDEVIEFVRGYTFERRLSDLTERLVNESGGVTIPRGSSGVPMMDGRMFVGMGSSSAI